MLSRRGSVSAPPSVVAVDARRIGGFQRILQKLVQLVLLGVGGAAGVVALTTGVLLLAPQLGRIGSAASFSPPVLGTLEPLSERSHVYDRWGKEIAILRSEENRQQIPLSDIPQHMIQAVIDIEDSAFYRHKGVNLRATARALFANVEAGGVAQGGSTITQQLVKNALLTNKRDLSRKVKEARLALELEKRMSKQEILERYLNTVYFGKGAYGVQAAAERYFDKQAAGLSVGDAAFLAGMIRNPLGYDPVRFPDRARQRRATVLDRMVELDHLTRDDADRWEAALLPRPVDRLLKPDTYFVEEVKQELLDDPRLGETSRDRYESVFNGGLSIYTTFDARVQGLAEDAVKEVLDPTDRPEFTASLVSLEVDSGAVRAMVAGRGFETDKSNLATQGRRQPGSSWKPFTLIAAIESGASTQSVISGVEPCAIPNPFGKPDPYLPDNAEGSKGQVATLVDQITRSSNCAFARLATIVGLDRVISVARRLGISSRLDAVPAMALGTEEVSPLEMAGAYATIAADGVYHRPYFIERVVGRDGKVIFTASKSGRRAISAQTARLTTEALRSVVQRGTGTAASLSRREVAGKTGTAQNNEDAWFVGYTPQLATAVWMGAPEGKVPMRNVGGIRVTGGSYPARIWRAFMVEALQGRPRDGFIEPDSKAQPKAGCLELILPKGYSASGAPSSGSRRAVAAGGRGFAVAVVFTQEAEPTRVPVNRTVTKVNTPKRTATAKKSSGVRGCTGGASAASGSTTRRTKTTVKPQARVPVRKKQAVVVADAPSAPVTAAPETVSPPPTLAPEPVPPAAAGGEAPAGDAA